MCHEQSETYMMNNNNSTSNIQTTQYMHMREKNNLFHRYKLQENMIECMIETLKTLL